MTNLINLFDLSQVVGYGNNLFSKNAVIDTDKYRLLTSKDRTDGLSDEYFYDYSSWRISIAGLQGGGKSVEIYRRRL